MLLVENVARAQEIDAFFKRKASQRDKKKVLGTFFEILGFVKYNYEKDICIASKIEVNEIDEEIKHIIGLINKIY